MPKALKFFLLTPSSCCPVSSGPIRLAWPLTCFNSCLLPLMGVGGCLICGHGGPGAEGSPPKTPFLFFSPSQTPAATGTAPPPVHKGFRKWGWGPLSAASSSSSSIRPRPRSPVTHPIFTNHHPMGKSGHTGKIPKAAENIAGNPMSITPGTGHLGNPKVGHADSRTGCPKGDEEMQQQQQQQQGRGWWTTGPGGNLRRSVGKAPGAQTPLWKGGRSMTRERRPRLQKGGESDRPPAGERETITVHRAAAAGLWNDFWIRGAPRSAGEGTPQKGARNPPTGGECAPRNGGERGPWTKGIEKTKSVSGKGRRRGWSPRPPAALPSTPQNRGSRGGALTRNAALTSASESQRPPWPWPLDFGCCHKRVPRWEVSNLQELHSWLFSLKRLVILGISDRHLCIWNLLRKEIYEKYCAWCILLKKVFFKCILLGGGIICQMLPSQRDVNFAFYICCRIVPFGAGAIVFFLSWFNGGVDLFL